MKSCTFRSVSTSATGVRSNVRSKVWRCVARYMTSVAVICLAAEHVRASNVQLSLTTSDPTQSSGTWTVTATLSDNQSLGIESFEINVLGSANGINGVTVLPASNFLNTLQVSNPPYSTARSNGTPRAPNLMEIYASQDIITAAGNRDPSGLRFGDGLVRSATSSVYGTILPGGPLVLASGRWVANGTGGTMRA